MSVSILKTVQPAGNERLLRDLGELASRLDTQQLWWASGYLAGVASAGGAGAAAAMAEPTAEQDAAPAWTVFYATETGNSRSIADDVAARIRAGGAEARVQDLADIRVNRLKQETRALFVVATHGLGEAPDGTESFFEALSGERAPRLESLRYAVLALGDSSYEDFCLVGQRLDQRLAELGAQRLLDRVDCDVDFETPSDAWQQQVVTEVSRERAAEPAARTPAGAAGPHLVPVTPHAPSRREPFAASVVENHAVTGRGSSKTVQHLVLDIEDSGIHYAPGDALGIWPTNPPQLVQQFLDLQGLDGDTPVRVDDETLSLREALAHRSELTLLGRGFVDSYAARFDIGPLRDLLTAERRAELADYLSGRQVIDVLREHHQAMTAQDLVDVLKRLTPRLYSIASSEAANPGEVHLTVAVVRYEAFGEAHYGSTSNYLLEPGDTVPVYVAPNLRFRLPEDAAAPVIMIGAGTGVAPYRAFLQEREQSGAAGDNWLFFGDRNFGSDFLYQVEWARWRESGLLSRHDVAFSRDQAEKIYVQDRIRERAADLFTWLERGAHVYVCGDAEHMAPDVHEALLDVIERAGGRDRAAAEDYLSALKRAERYQRDVY